MSLSVLQRRQGVLRVLQPVSAADIDERLKKVEADDLVHAWQRHRTQCLEMAIKIGVQTAEEAVELAEKLGAYILRGKPQ